MYVYPSHDIDAGVPHDDLGSHFAMRDYHVLSMDSRRGGDRPGSRSTSRTCRGRAGRCGRRRRRKGGTYFLYFPAKDKQGVFRIGVATAPARPARSRPTQPIAGSVQHRPGGLRGRRRHHVHVLRRHLGRPAAALGDRRVRARGRPPGRGPPALPPRWRNARRHARLRRAPRRAQPSTPREAIPRRPRPAFLRGLVAAQATRGTTTSPTRPATRTSWRTPPATTLGPFTHRGHVLDPVVGWTTHHSIVEFQGRWYLFYHDSTLSGGVTHQRCVKVSPIRASARRLDRDDHAVQGDGELRGRARRAGPTVAGPTLDASLPYRQHAVHQPPVAGEGADVRVVPGLAGARNWMVIDWPGSSRRVEVRDLRGSGTNCWTCSPVVLMRGVGAPPRWPAASPACPG